jgi:predicted RNA-binding Zn ribbon-like protein
MKLLYLGGDPAIDLVNTVDWTSRGPEAERLLEPGDLVRWAEGAGLLQRGQADRLARTMARHPREAERALERARLTRLVLHDLFAALASGQPSDAALARFNRLLSDALDRAALVRTGSRGRPRLAWEWKELDARSEAVLAPVLWSAARLLTSADGVRIRVCGGTDCGWMFVDRSRNGLRRWCQMRTCGTQEKSRRRREGITA